MEMHRMRRVCTSLSFALLLLGAAGTASAGTVYVPLAMDAEFAGSRYQTQVWVSNRGGVARRFDALFIEAGRDGAARQGLTPSSTRVVNGTTFLLGSVAPLDKIGMLEISGADPLVVSARLVGSTGLGATIPVVSSANLVPAGGTAHLLDLQRDATHVSNLAVLNLAHQAAQCTLRLFRSDSQQIGADIQVTLPPLSQRPFGDLLAPAGNVAGARAAVRCDQQFYAFGASFDMQNGEALVKGPAAATDAGLPTPGIDGVLCGAAQAGRRCFDQAGVFFTPARGTPTRRITLPFPNKVEYKKVTVDIDITHGGWFAAKPDGIHNFFWIAQGTNIDRIGYANARGPGRDLIYAVHHIGFPRAVEAPRIEGSYAMQPGETYHVSYTYDAANLLVTLNVKTAAGQVVFNGTNSQLGTRRIFTTTQPYLIDFGLTDEAADAPTYGWKYANLRVQFFE
jgi:hypothetical protein